MGCGMLLNLCIVMRLPTDGDRWELLEETPAYGHASFAYGFFTIALYVCGIACTLRGPSRIRCYASVRALSYMVSFAFTGLPVAVASSIMRTDNLRNDTVNKIEIVNLCFSLNGAANAITYAFWVTRPRNRIQTTAEIESSMIRHFFDLDELGATDDDVFLARRAAEIAVAEANALRRG